MSQESKPRRIIAPQKAKQIDTSRVNSAHIIAPDAKSLIEEALTIIGIEITRYRGRVAKGQPLDMKEARVLQGYIRSLTELSKESRERHDDEDLSKLQDEEIFDLFISKLPQDKLQHLLRLTAQKRATEESEE